MSAMERVMGVGSTVQASYTRPADTTAYTGGDVVADSTSAATILTFAALTKDMNGGAIIQEALLIDSANQSTKPDLELWLFDTTFAIQNDNAAWAPTDAQLEGLVGVIPFSSSSFKSGDATSGAGGNCACDVQGLGMPVNTKGGKVDLFGVLVVRNAYTPVSAEKFTIRLKVLH